MHVQDGDTHDVTDVRNILEAAVIQDYETSSSSRTPSLQFMRQRSQAASRHESPGASSRKSQSLGASRRSGLELSTGGIGAPAIRRKGTFSAELTGRSNPDDTTPACEDDARLRSASEARSAQQSLVLQETPPKRPLSSARPIRLADFVHSPPPINDDDIGNLNVEISPSRPHSHAGMRPRGPQLLLSTSMASMSPTSTISPFVPDTPMPDRSGFKDITAGVVIIFFDFDGTLTSTPGDRAERCQKLADLCERASMLRPWLCALQSAGATMGIISKSTESTIRDALAASDLDGFWSGPIIGKAVGFEGKAGFIEELARKGALPRLGGRGLGPGPRSVAAARRVLLVDDDVLELERARGRGLQVYAAPEDGGLREEDFHAILEAVRVPFAGGKQISKWTFPPRQSHRSVNSSVSTACTTLPSLLPGPSVRSQSKQTTKWRTPIFFLGECFER